MTAHKKTKRNPRGSGRNPLPEGEGHEERATCWMTAAQKTALDDAVKAGRGSASALLLAGLRTIGVIPDDSSK